MSTRNLADRLAAALFGVAVGGRSALYNAGVLPVQKVPGIVVISVGNLALGGTGKTPFSLYLAEKLRDSGEEVAVVLRGYGGTLMRRGAVVGRGKGALEHPRQVGDEAVLIARRARGVSVWIGADRLSAVKNARDAGATVAVLDDGFQHRRLHRDLDILLSDPKHLDAGAPLFPRGDLREPAAASGRADLIGGRDALWQTAARSPDFTFELAPTHMERADGAHLPLDAVSLKRVYLVAGIARPERFHQTVARLGAAIVGQTLFRDHHVFSLSELEVIDADRRKSGADLVLTTEKDWVRSASAFHRILGDAVMALILDLKMKHGEAKVDKAIARCLENSR